MTWVGIKLKLTAIPLPQLSECWNYRYTLPHLTHIHVPVGEEVEARMEQQHRHPGPLSAGSLASKAFSLPSETFMLTNSSVLPGAPTAPGRQVELMRWHQGPPDWMAVGSGLQSCSSFCAHSRHPPLPFTCGPQPVAVPDLSAFCPQRFLSQESWWGTGKKVSARAAALVTRLFAPSGA